MRFYSGLVNAAAASVLAVTMAYGSAALANEGPVAPTQPVTTQSDTTLAAKPAAVPVAPVAAPEKFSTQQTSLTTAWTVTANPYFSPALIAAMAMLYAAGCMVAAKRGVRGAWLRATAGVALVAGLINPEITVESHAPLATEVAVVVDKSASQSLDGRDVATSTVYKSVMDQLSKIPGLEVRTVEAGTQKSGANADGSNLFSALDGGLLDVPPDRLGAVIMLTDGQVHDVPKQFNQQDSGAPVHVLLSGHDGEKDRVIVADSTPLYGIVGKDLTIKFHVTDNGVAPGQSGQVQVTVKADGVPVATQAVTPGEPAEVTMKVPHGGANVIELTADALPGELTPLNNSLVASVTGVRDHLRVLLVSGEPNADERTWRNLLKSDPSTDLVHFTILRPPDKQDLTPLNELSLIAFPTRQLFSEKLGQFDLVILDHYQNRGILPSMYFDNLVAYVRGGGALMIANGPEYAGTDSLNRTPLSAILPTAPTGNIVESPYFPHLTETGERHPVTRGLAGANTTPDGQPQWGAWTRLIESTKNAGDVVMDGAGNNPLLVLNHEGQGRVAVIMSDSAWLWSRGVDGGGPYADLLQRTTHWLMKEADLEEEALRLTAQNGELTIEQQTMADSSAPVTIHSPSGKTETVSLKAVSPGVWRATLPADELGLYSVEQGDKKAFTNVGTATPKEFANTLSTPDLLKPIADATKGEITRMTAPAAPYAVNTPAIRAVHNGDDMSGQNWMGIRMTEAYAMKSSSKLSLLSGWLGFSLLLGALAAAWYRDGDGAWFRRENWTRKTGAQKDAAPKDTPKPSV